MNSERKAKLDEALEHFSLSTQSFINSGSYSDEIKEVADEICRQTFYVLAELRDAIVDESSN